MADDLLVNTAGGDRAAFLQLHDLVAARVYGLALRLSRSPAQAEALTQQILVEVWRRADQFNPEHGSAVAWILRLAHRRAVESVRSVSARRAREQRVAEALESGDDLVVAGVRLEGEDRRMGEMLSFLTDAQRQAIELAFYDGYSYREVAQLLDAADGTIKSRLIAAARRLRTVAEEQ